MRRFQSVEAKVRPGAPTGTSEYGGSIPHQPSPAAGPTGKLTKAQQMRQRMEQEKGGVQVGGAQIQMERNVNMQRPPKAARDANPKPLPPRGPPKSNMMRQSAAAMSQGESIYGMVEPQPIVVQYKPE